jgi:hypothetical protein
MRHETHAGAPEIPGPELVNEVKAREDGCFSYGHGQIIESCRMNGNRKFLMLYYIRTSSIPLLTATEGQPRSNPIYFKKNSSTRRSFHSLLYDLHHTADGRTYGILITHCCRQEKREIEEREKERRCSKKEPAISPFTYTPQYLKGENDEVLEKDSDPGKCFFVQQYGFFSDPEERLCRVPQEGDARRRSAVSRRQDVEGRR